MTQQQFSRPSGTAIRLPYAHPRLQGSRQLLTALARHYAITLVPALACFAIAMAALIHILSIVGLPKRDLIDLGRESYATTYGLVIEVWLALGGFAAAFALVVLTVRRLADARSRAADDLSNQVPLARTLDN